MCPARAAGIVTTFAERRDYGWRTFIQVCELGR